MQALDTELKPEHYELAFADLDDDGAIDVLAYTNGQSGYCGSGGCTLFILHATKSGLKPIGRVPVVQRPIYLRESKQHGVRDLLVRISGGGATPGFSVLAHDGKGYPASPGQSAEVNQPLPADKLLFGDDAGLPFTKTLKLLNVTYTVTSSNKPGANRVTITPSGLENDTKPISVDTPASAKGAEVADLNADGSPEIYVYMVEPPGNRGGLIAFSVNRMKSLSIINMPALTDDPKLASGYRGGDEFAVVELSLVRRFPIYPIDANKPDPTGKMRQLQYKLTPGEANWQLKLDKVIEY